MLTVVIPSYNHSEYILDSLKAALSVDLPGLKVLVIDDGSKDDSVAKVQEFIAQQHLENKVTVIAKANGGLVSSLNLALELVDTEFCWIVASDDILVPEGVKALCGMIAAKPSLGFILGGGHYFYDDGVAGSIYKKVHSRFFELKANQRDLKIFTDFPSPILLQSSVFRVQALKEVGGWDPALKWDDYPLFVKLLQRYRDKGEHFEFMPEVDCVGYRQHPDNTYRNIYGQYCMVEQTMGVLAPPSLRRKAVARAFAFYALLSLKNKNFSSLRRMLQDSSLREIVYGVVSVPVVAFKYLLTKI